MLRASNYDTLCKLTPDELGWTFTVTTKENIRDDYESTQYVTLHGVDSKKGVPSGTTSQPSHVTVAGTQHDTLNAGERRPDPKPPVQHQRPPHQGRRFFSPSVHTRSRDEPVSMPVDSESEDDERYYVGTYRMHPSDMLFDYQVDLSNAPFTCRESKATRGPSNDCGHRQVVVHIVTETHPVAVLLMLGSHDTWLFSNLAPMDQRPMVVGTSTYSAHLYWAKDEQTPGRPKVRKGKGIQTDRKGKSLDVDATYVGFDVHKVIFLLRNEDKEPVVQFPFEFGAVTSTWFGKKATL
ncbi:hypothetical protein DXG03_008809 [Asterophora parasitica]|uniref:Uncharacterized protein n=1 Tax=Asterophora parasitica TaxID=117018 RepID=A0A9P7K8Z2_9AGAR|nr:hypothetical protein DXG03_008809 [Asterophora parasitica]